MASTSRPAETQPAILTQHKKAFFIMGTSQEVNQPSYYSATMTSGLETRHHQWSSDSRNQSAGELAKAIFTFRRPPHFPCASTQRKYQMRVRNLVSGVDPDALKKMPAPAVSEFDIPTSVLFDNMLHGEARSPIRLEDFANYLTVEGTAQNLDFLLWYKDYTHRFGLLTAEEMILHPPWTNDDHERALRALAVGTKCCPNAPEQKRTSSQCSFKGWQSLPSSSFSEKESSGRDEKDAPRPSIAPSDNGKEDFGILRMPSIRISKVRHGIVPILMAEKPLDIKLVAPWDEPPLSYTPYFKPSLNVNFLLAANQCLPVTIDSLRAEVDTAIQTHLTCGSPSTSKKKIDFQDSIPDLISYSVARSLHPSSLYPVVSHVEHVLKNESFPRFLLSVYGNANSARLNCLKAIGVAIMPAGLAASVLCIVKGWHRSLRIPGVTVTAIGTVIIYAAWRDMCLILHWREKFQQKPWETELDSGFGLEKASVSSLCEDVATHKVGGQDVGDMKFESAPGWAQRYQRRWFLSRIFDRERRLEEQYIIRGHRMIFWQAMWAGGLVCGALLMVFLSV